MAQWPQPVPGCTYGYNYRPPPPHNGYCQPYYGHPNGYQNFNYNQGRGYHHYPAQNYNYNGRGHPFNGRGGHQFSGRGWRGTNRGRGGQVKQIGQASHKPWINSEIIAAMKERKQAEQKFFQTQDKDDRRIWKAIRSRTTLLINDAKFLYEEKMRAEGGGPIKSEFYCDTCDRSFETHDLYQTHVAGHVTCKLDGCKFTAQPKVLLKHIEMQHSGNLFSRVKGFESPAEMEKWKQDRKINYPTVEKVETSRKTKSEQLKRGERIPNHNLRKRMGHGQRHTRDQRKPYQRNGMYSPKKIQNSSNVVQSHNNETFRNRTPQNNNQSESNCTNQPNLLVTPPIRKTNGLVKGPNTIENLVVLENFYAQVRVGDNGALVGKNFMAWDIKCQMLCRKGISGIAKMGQSEDTDDEDFVDESKQSICITDEEDEMEDTLTTTSTSIHETSGSFTETGTKGPKNTLVLGLVSYSSDSEGEPPDEISTISMKEDGEISEGEVDS